jgi:hypothetical protein
MKTLAFDIEHRWFGAQRPPFRIGSTCFIACARSGRAFFIEPETTWQIDTPVSAAGCFMPAWHSRQAPPPTRVLR